MKTTVKLSLTETVLIEPVGEGVRLVLTTCGLKVADKLLTADQVGALQFAIDAAAEAVELARQNRRAREIAGQGAA